MRGHVVPEGLRDYNFAAKDPINPSTRSVAFSDLKVAELHAQIKSLPVWQQMQEMEPWFSPTDVAMIFLSEHYPCSVSKTHDKLSPDSIEFQLRSMGFSGEALLQHHFVYNRVGRLKKQVSDALAILEETVASNTTTTMHAVAAHEKSFTIDGPIARTYVVSQTARTRVIMNPDNSRACVKARMKFFHDVA